MATRAAQYQRGCSKKILDYFLFIHEQKKSFTIITERWRVVDKDEDVRQSHTADGGQQCLVVNQT
jgi:hypothetical protein